jgi:uncharacterized protein (TIGR02646 family)
MIRVTRGDRPDGLAIGERLAEEFKRDYETAPEGYRLGRQTFEIDSAIYGHATVKNALRLAQHAKCCFCEGKFEANAAADVEHYRPKAYTQQARGSRKIYPGYYWLGYAWTNLLYSCQICNRSYKRNYFPLRDPGTRARSHLDDLSAEVPMLLDPAGLENPRDHIRFRDEIAVGMTKVGETTINYVGLNRLRLVEERLEHLQYLQTLRQILDTFDESVEPEKRRVLTDAEAILDAAVDAQARFSAMATDLLQGTGPA